jgi:hypothetical protein
VAEDNNFVISEGQSLGSDGDQVYLKQGETMSMAGKARASCLNAGDSDEGQNQPWHMTA